MRSLVLPLALVLPLLAACARGPSRPLNVVLVVVDTLRQDAIGTLGSPLPTSPHVDALAATGAAFVRSYATSPWTLPSVASILTGLPPVRHDALRPRQALPDEAETLAELLRGAGYRTAGVVSHIFLQQRYGMAQGFERFEESEARGHDHVSTPGVTRQALELMRDVAAGPAPFFLYVHYFDPHYDYVRHPEFGLADVPPGRLTGTEGIRDLLELAPDMTAAERDFLWRSYGEEVRLTDAGIGTIVRELETMGVRDDTLIVVTADHGEEFLEHDRWIGHTVHLYDTDMRVPLVIRDPRMERPGRLVPQPVSLVDLASTILDLAGVDAPRGPRGPSFAGVVRRDAPREEYDVVCEVDFEPVYPRNEEKVSRKRALVRGDVKLIRDDLSGGIELYDLAADPGEQRDLASVRPDVAAVMGRALEEHTRAAGVGRLESHDVELSPQKLERLRSLGYAAD